MLSFRTNGDFIDFVNIDDTSLHVETILISLHNTSRAIAWNFDADPTKISFSVSGLSYGNVLITDIDFDGVTMTEQADFKTNIEAMFPGLAGSTGSYLIYAACLSQTGTANPVVEIELENTIGAIVWTRNTAGTYYGTLSGAFPTERTVCPPFGRAVTAHIAMFLSTPGDTWYRILVQDTNRIAIQIMDAAGDPIEWSGTFAEIFIEVRVYQTA